jgi:hypothetical protein
LDQIEPAGTELSRSSEKSVVDFSEYEEREKYDFPLSYIFSDLQSLKMAAHPCAAGNSG